MVDKITTSISPLEETAKINEIIDNASAINTSLSGKADVDLSNTSPSQSFKNNVISWGIPDYANGITISASDGSYTAPATGVFYIAQYGGAAGYITSLQINNVSVPASEAVASGEYRNTFYYLVEKNSVITWSATIATSTTLEFYPMKGGN